MRLKCSHHTRFRYAEPVTDSHKLLRLTPRAFAGQQVLASRIDVQPAPDSTATRPDAHGNTLTEIVVRQHHRELTILAEAEVDVLPAVPIDFDRSPPWDRLAASLRAPSGEPAWEAVPFCFPSPRIALDGAREFARPVFAPGTPLLRVATALAARIHGELDYQGGVTDIDTPVAEVLRKQQGVCQDFTHLAIACLRAFGLPARYVSGYLLTDRHGDGAGLTGGDASHAWFSVWCPQFGWIDFDPTNDLMPNEQHITLAWGRDYGDVTPTAGFIRGGGNQQLDVGVRVSRA